tara:strand:+ start:145 stop:306 length:162 start_codon:yes stop_codon:yes gene_type:complete
MNKNSNSRNGSTHLYNRKKEGLGSYDIHYINANINKNIIKNKQNETNTERHAA